jgi:hypothetical protein
MLAYYGKIAIHPTPLATLADLWRRAAVGPIPGQLIVLAGAIFFGSWFCLGFVTLYIDRRQRLRDWRRLWSSEPAVESAEHNPAVSPLD